jgi:ribosomal protein L35
MTKTKTHKATKKRIKVTRRGKVLRRHQLAKGHLRAKKPKKKTRHYRRLASVAKADLSKIKQSLGL